MKRILIGFSFFLFLFFFASFFLTTNVNAAACTWCNQTQSFGPWTQCVPVGTDCSCANNNTGTTNIFTGTAQTDTACTSGSAQCSQISGCSSPGGPNPDLCKINGGPAAGAGCWNDTECRNRGDINCSQFYCMEDTGTYHFSCSITAGTKQGSCKLYTTGVPPEPPVGFCIKPPPGGDWSCQAGTCTNVGPGKGDYTDSKCNGVCGSGTGNGPPSENAPIGGGVAPQIPNLSALGIVGVPIGGVGTLNKVLGVAVSLLILIAILLCLFYIIWGAYFWITSEGDKQKLHQARQRIVFALIGLILVFAAWAILAVINNFFFGTPAPLPPCATPPPLIPVPCR